MKVNSIARNNYNNINQHTINNSSKTAFKGKNYAKVLEKFDFGYGNDNIIDDIVFNGIKQLFNLASIEPGFKITDLNIYNKLNEAKSSGDFWEFFDKLYLKCNEIDTIIAEDAEGPLITYNLPDNSLKFLSCGKSVTIGSSDGVFGGCNHKYDTENKSVLW